MITSLLCMHRTACPSMLNVDVQPFSHIFCRQITTNPLHFKLQKFSFFSLLSPPLPHFLLVFYLYPLSLSKLSPFPFYFFMLKVFEGSSFFQIWLCTLCQILQQLQLISQLYCFFKTVSSSTSYKKAPSLRLSLQEFKKILHNTFIFESILIKI